jgi:hypothetical protein
VVTHTAVVRLPDVPGRTRALVADVQEKQTKTRMEPP